MIPPCLTLSNIRYISSVKWSNPGKGIPCFHWLFTKRHVYKNGRSPAFYFFFLCFDRGTSVACRDHGGGLALLESSRGYCRSWYDAEITRNRQWRQCITEDLPDASKMYDWNIYIYIKTMVDFGKSDKMIISG